MNEDTEAVAEAPAAPADQEIEIVTTASDHEKRAEILQRIEAERNSKAILYVTGDRPGMDTQISKDVIDLFVDHLDRLWPVERLSLILHTSGGDTAAAWGLINLLRTFCDYLEIIVTSRAHSAGSLMCLGADRIVMTKQATLSPIDPSLIGPFNPLVPGAASSHRTPVSVEAVQGYLDLAQEVLKIKDPASLTTVLTNLAGQIHPLVLGQIFRTRTQIRTLAKKLLVYQKISEKKTEAIISFLCSESGSHDHTINRRDARELGLKIEKPSQDFYGVLRELNESVTDTLKLRTPFKPDTELAGRASVRYLLRRGIIESRDYGSHQFVSEGELRRIQSAEPGKVPTVGIQDNRTSEGWRWEA